MSANASNQAVVLIVEDGDEYLHALQQLPVAWRWQQAKSARAAVQWAATQPVAAVVLDMRFDRIARADLAGDHAALAREFSGDGERAWKHLALHQGLYVLAALRAAGCLVPVLLAYDFGREMRRFEALQRMHGRIDWIGDDATAALWTEKIAAMLH